MFKGALRPLALCVAGGLPLVVTAAPSAIVVGGGMAGLSSAYELQQKGWQVTLLEGGKEIGGRSSLSNGEWIGSPSRQPLIYQYLKTFKLDTSSAPDIANQTGFLIDGKAYSAQELRSTKPQTAQSLQRFDDAYAQLFAKIADPLEPLANKEAKNLDSSSVARWLDSLGLEPTARGLIDQRIRIRYDEPSRLSLLFFAQQGKTYGGLWANEDRKARLPGGNKVLAQAFAKNIKSIKTDNKVTSISYDNQGVTVKAGNTSYKADYVIVSVALPALDKIQFSPALPSLAQKAIKDINYSWHDQIQLKFKKPVWGNERLTGDIYSEKGLGMVAAEPAKKGGASLLLTIGGDNARLMKPFGDRQMMEQFLIRLEDRYKGSREQMAGYEVRRYETNPLFGGGFLAYGPGEISQYWGLWEQPAGRVIFAGEHTDRLYPATYEGALRSGQRAAQQAQLMASGQSPAAARPAPAGKSADTAPASSSKKDSGFFQKLTNWF